MTCDCCDCWDCTQAQRKAEKDAHLKDLCSRWNWNATPIAVARDIIDSELGQDEIIRAMRDHGFRDADIDLTLDAIEELK